ncbi:hypothetical protein SAMN04488067_104179 [Halorubrum xinjiangense]|uniref:DUF7993 domain-containing protein n=1 Tax=Halorubrum xinjiangense TaxID=261291 RepID=A0A1G7L1B3_9EURY|nr:hypothetical protein [Halorubrum xinjiangense]SDF43332.1 hypothetical protein SAMN04488067_104179 [Halorubrum xinjiangense]
MVTDRLTDGVRIAQLLASEVTGNESDLRGLTVADADPDVEPTADGELAYRIVRERGDSADEFGGDESAEPVAEVYVQPDRARIEAIAAPDAAATAAGEVDLRVRPKTVHPPRTLVFVEDGAQVKRALPVLTAVRNASDDE